MSHSQGGKNMMNEKSAGVQNERILKVDIDLKVNVKPEKGQCWEFCNKYADYCLLCEEHRGISPPHMKKLTSSIPSGMYR